MMNKSIEIEAQEAGLEYRLRANAAVVGYMKWLDESDIISRCTHQDSLKIWDWFKCGWDSYCVPEVLLTTNE